MTELDYSRFSPFNERQGNWLASLAATDDLSVGESTLNRKEVNSIAVTCATQDIRLTYFTAEKDETINNVSVTTGSTAAAATPTICRIGIYSVASNGDLTLLASTANDTTLFAAANTLYTRALTSAFTKQKGVRYAVGIIVVTAVAAPTFTGMLAPQIALTAIAPRITALLAAQANLVTPITSGTLTNSSSLAYVAMTP